MSPSPRFDCEARLHPNAGIDMIQGLSDGPLSSRAAMRPCAALARFSACGKMPFGFRGDVIETLCFLVSIEPFLKGDAADMDLRGDLIAGSPVVPASLMALAISLPSLVSEGFFTADEGERDLAENGLSSSCSASFRRRYARHSSFSWALGVRRGRIVLPSRILARSDLGEYLFFVSLRSIAKNFVWILGGLGGALDVAVIGRINF